ncbi:probable cytochrome P450 6a13 [Microplitis demolitor]|uniref:probable cytochrome P450 6a13 n=1 Tax=Microplitis demolitor TaxID=69319 RepID=UPI00235B6D2E|nr:probable cytochrome P450 6a13 [Microplitis demolitor]
MAFCRKLRRICRKISYWKLNKINGPKPFPFVGTIIQVLIGKLSIGNYTKKIYDQYPGERMVGVYAGTKKVLILRDLELIRDVMVKDFSSFVDRGLGYHDKHEPLSANVGLVDEGRWRLLRRQLTPVFSSTKLKKMFSLLIGCTDPLIKNLTSVDGHVVDIGPVMKKYAIDVIGVCAFGLKIDALLDDDNLFYKMGHRFFKPTLKNFLRLRLKSYAPFLYKFIGGWFTDWELQKFFITLTRDNIEHRKKFNENRNDFIDLLMTLKENSQDSYDTVLAAQLFIFFVAGYETSASTISNCVFELAINSEIQNKLRDEINCELISCDGNITYDGIENMKYLDKVVCETLRKYPPINFTLRRSTQSYKFSGTNLTIPKGTIIWIPIAGIHRNSEYYPNPDVFDPERFKTEEINNRPQMSYLPFGAGPRNCIGLRFAKMEVKIAVIKLIQHFKIDVCDETDVNYTIDEKLFLLAPLNGIRLKVTKL